MTDGRRAGFTLVELLVALAVSAVLTTGMVQLALATTAGFRLQQELAALQESGRFLGQQLQDAIRPAGFHREPWRLATPAPAIGAGSAHRVSTLSDRLELRRWSDQDCFDNPNPTPDDSGRPAYWLRVTGFEARNGNLAMRCQYGADDASLVLQLNNLGLAEGVEAFAVRFAEDSDVDGHADRWVTAGQWLDESRILGVRYGLVLASARPVPGAGDETLWWLDGAFSPPDDGRLRRVIEGTVALSGRVP